MKMIEVFRSIDDYKQLKNNIHLPGTEVEEQEPKFVDFESQS